MEIFKFLSKVLWFTIILFAFYWVVKYVYRKLRPEKHSFFYFHAIEKKDREWKVKIEAPTNDFDLVIEILNNGDLITKKNACLKAGMNKVTLKSSELNLELKAILKISSSDQKLERKV